MMIVDLHERIWAAAEEYNVDPALVAAILYDELQRRGVEDTYQDYIGAPALIIYEGFLENLGALDLGIRAGVVTSIKNILKGEAAGRPFIPIEDQSFGIAQMNVGTVYDLVEAGYLDAPEGWANDRLDCSLIMLLDNTMAPTLVAARVRQTIDHWLIEGGPDLSNRPEILGTLYCLGLVGESGVHDHPVSSERGNAIADSRECMEELLNYSPPPEPEPERIPTPPSTLFPSEPSVPAPTPTPTPTPIPSPPE